MRRIIWKPLTAFLVACVFLSGGACTEAFALIDIKVSVKWVRSSDGTVGPGDMATQLSTGVLFPCDEVTSEAEFLERIEYANRILALSGRGYRFVVEFATITPPPAAPGQNCGDKGTPGAPNGCSILSSCPTVTPPPIVINEIMPAPTLAKARDGEWFEVLNTTGAPIDMLGWQVMDGGSQSFTITQSVVVPAGGYAVFGPRADFTANGNVPVDYEYGTALTLDNGGDEIILLDDLSNEIDRVEYNGGWPVVAGASMCLTATTLDNNCSGAWVNAADTYWSEWTILGGNCRQTIEAAALADTVTWKWDPNAMNIYYGTLCTGGASATTRKNHVTMAIGQHEAGGYLRPFHEIGHALGICHTHDCFDWSPLPCFCVEGTVGLDCLADTPPDNAGWNNGDPPGDLANTIANNAFGSGYDALTCEQKQQVLDVTYNIMSYHRDDDWGYPNQQPPLDCIAADLGPIDCSVPASSLPEYCRYRLSPDQLDRISNFSNTLLRRARDLGITGRFASGLTHFVDQNAGPCPGWCNTDDSTWECWPGSSIVPHTTVQAALNAIDAEDEPGMDHIILLRPGSYDEALTIDRRVDLRGSRGSSVLGK